LTSNDIFEGITLKQRKVMRENLAKEKKVRERMERTEFNYFEVGGDTTKLTSGDLTILLAWHKVPKVIGTNKEQKLTKWGRIVSSGKPPPSYEKWTEEDELRLEEAQLDVVEMAHTTLGQMEALKKKELVLVARAMSEEEFNQLVLARNDGGAAMTDEGIVNSVRDGDGDDGLLPVENPDILNVGGVRSLDFEEHAGAV